VAGLVKNTFLQRLQGDRPSPLKAVLVATATGAAAAVLTYRLMRS
jgi:hypothetical protein